MKLKPPSIKAVFLIFLFFNVLFLDLNGEDLERPHFNWGKTTLIPRIFSEINYDDNVFLSKDSKRTDFSFLNRGSLSVESILNFGLNISLKAEVFDSDFLKFDAEDFQGYLAGGNVLYHLGSHNKFSVSGRAGRKRDIVGLDLNTKDLIDNEELELNYHFNANRLNVQLQANYLNLDFDKLINQIFEKETKGGKVNSFYELDRITYKMNLIYNVEEFEFDPVKDNANYHVEFGVLYNWTKNLQTEIKMGWKRFEFENSVESEPEILDEDGPIGSLLIEFKHLEHLTFKFKQDYITQIGYTNLTQTLFYNIFSIEYQPTSKYTYLIIFGYDFLKGDISGNYQQKSIKTKLQYDGIRYFRFTGFVEYLDVTSSNATGNEYDRFKLGFSIEATW